MTSGNVGRLDAMTRVVIAFALLVAAHFFIQIDPDAALMVVLPTFLAMGYLLLTAAIGEDIVYSMLDVDTVGVGIHIHKHMPRPWHH